MKILFLISLLFLVGCSGFDGKRTSTIKVNILGNTWESSTTLDGTYTKDIGKQVPAK
jgi:hypothetical protein